MQLKCTGCNKPLEEGVYCYVLTLCAVVDEGKDYERDEDWEIWCLDCAPPEWCWKPIKEGAS